MPTKPNKKAVLARQDSLQSADILTWLTANPSFFTQHAADLSQLAQPSKGGNILSLHALKEQRTAQKAEQLKAKHQQIVAAAHSNALTAQVLMGQTVQAAALTTLAKFRTYVQTGLKDALALDATRLMLVGEAGTATTLTAEEITELCPHNVTLRTLYKPEERGLYGVKGKLVRSDCLMKLYDAQSNLVGLLGMGSEQETRFYEGQETLLAELFGRTLGVLLGRLAPCKS